MVYTTLIGYRQDGTPIWLHVGGDGKIIAGPDDPDAPDPGDEEDPDDEVPEDQTGDTTGDGAGEPNRGDDDYPPSREEWDRVRQRLSKTTKESMRRKERLRQLAAGNGTTDTTDTDTGKGQTPTPQTTPEPAPAEQTTVDLETATQQAAEKAAERAAERAALATESKLMPVLVREATKAALAAAGWSGGGSGLATDDQEKRDKALNRVMRLIDLEQVDVDDNGTITGVDEQIQGLKEEFPEWFRRPAAAAANRQGAEAVDGAPRRQPPARRQRTWIEKVDGQLSGRRR